MEINKLNDMKNEYMKPMVDFKEIAPLIEKAMEYQNKGYGTAFVRISGHTGHMEIDFHPYGWKPNSRAEHIIHLSLDTEFTQEDVELRMHDIDLIISEQLTVEQHEAMVQRSNEEFERKQYEKLKEKFGDV